MVDHCISSIDVATNISLQTQLSCYYHTNISNVCRVFIHGSINSMGGCFPIFILFLTNHFGCPIAKKHFGRSPKKEVS
jgi:hypothetical protein